MAISFLGALSHLCGWIYTLAWSLSFYPQPILNFARKSTSGTTVDFPAINALGFVAYFSSNAAFLYSPVIREQYARRNNGLTPTVQFNDLVFAGHAALLSLLTLTQYVPWIWGFDRCGKRGAGVRLSLAVKTVLLCSVLGVAIVAAAAALFPPDDGHMGTAWIDVVYAVSYVKLFITLIKYMPQVVTNYANRSTKGWSIYQILLDIVGGVFSLAQLGIDSYIQHDWSGVTGNPVKFLLGNISFVFDLVFILQHYFLYNDVRVKAEVGPDLPGRDEEGPLLRCGYEGP